MLVINVIVFLSPSLGDQEVGIMVRHIHVIMVCVCDCL